MIMATRRTLAREAMLKSIEVRTDAELGHNAPIDIYGLCEKLRVPVRFVDIGSMEGMYLRSPRVQILISALRPLPRRNFTCGHELGHHVFKHRMTIDELQDELSVGRTFQPREFLVQTFAGFLLMPTIGVRKAFALRGWDVTRATPGQLFTVACSFGVGYATLINHMAYGLEIIPDARARELLRVTLARIRRHTLGTESAAPLIVVDRHWLLPTLDAEVDTQLLLPNGTEVESDGLVWRADLPGGRLFQASRPGIFRVQCANLDWTAFARISRYQYVGFSQYRHLEDADDDDDEGGPPGAR